MTAGGRAAAVTGIDLGRVPGWLARSIPGATAPFRFELIEGGRSNMTFAVTDAAGRKLILRRPPMSHVLASAHDMGREHRIISALAGTPVPVPRALGFCDDESVNGAPFYVMDFVDGLVLRTQEETAARFGAAERAAIGANLADVLAAIHDVDPDAAGLGTLARPDAYIPRQLRRWNGQFEQSQEQERAAGGGVWRNVPNVTRAHELLSTRVPEQHGTAIVHGDYRLDNTILSPGGQVRAVLDWELCTLGDPLADVGTLLMYWAQTTTPPEPAVTVMPGFPTRAELAGRYAEASGRDLSQISFYIAFAYWKLACITEGVYVRFATHAMGGGAEEAGPLGDLGVQCARAAVEILEDAS